MSNQQNIEQFFQAFQRRIEAVNQKLPGIIGTEVINSATDNFRSESYFGKKWPKRKDKKNTRKLLVKTGTLQRSPRIIRSQPGLIAVGSDVPYAPIHNNGGNINRAARSETFVRHRYKSGKRKGLFKRGTTTGQGFTFKNYSINMPRRQFLGAHPKLKSSLQNIIKEEIESAFK